MAQPSFKETCEPCKESKSHIQTKKSKISGERPGVKLIPFIELPPEMVIDYRQAVALSQTNVLKTTVVDWVVVCFCIHYIQATTQLVTPNLAKVREHRTQVFAKTGNLGH